MDELKHKSKSLAAASASQGKEPRKFSHPADSAYDNKEETSKKANEAKQDKKDYKAQISSFLKEEFSPPPSLQGTIVKEQPDDFYKAKAEAPPDLDRFQGKVISEKLLITEESKRNIKEIEVKPSKAKQYDLPFKRNEVKRLYEEYADVKVLDDGNEDSIDDLDREAELELKEKENKNLGATWKKDALVEKINQENLFEYLKGLQINLGSENEQKSNEEGEAIREEEESIESPEKKEGKYDYNILSIPENYSEENGTSRKNTMRQEFKQSAGKVEISATASGSIIKKFEEEITEISKINDYLQNEMQEMSFRHEEEMKIEKSQHNYLLMENTKLKNQNIDMRNEISMLRSRLILSKESNNNESFFRESVDERNNWKGKVLSTIKSKRFSINNESRNEFSPNTNFQTEGKKISDVSPLSQKYARPVYSNHKGNAEKTGWEKRLEELMLQVEDLKQENESLFRKFLEIKDENKHLKNMVKDAKLELEQMKLHRKNSTKSFQNPGEYLDFADESSSLLIQNQEYGKTINKLCKIMCADHSGQLIQIAKKYEKCIKMIPKIEGFIQEICKIVFPQETIKEEDMEMKRVIKFLNEWKHECLSRDYHFSEIMNRIKAILKLEASRLSDEEIVQELEYALGGKISVNLSMRDKLYENFCKYFDVKEEENPLIVLNDIFKQNSDLSYFCKKLRHLLDIKGNLSSEDYLKAAVAALEDSLNVSRKQHNRKK